MANPYIRIKKKSKDLSAHDRNSLSNGVDNWLTEKFIDENIIEVINYFSLLSLTSIRLQFRHIYNYLVK